METYLLGSSLQSLWWAPAGVLWAVSYFYTMAPRDIRIVVFPMPLFWAWFGHHAFGSDVVFLVNGFFLVGVLLTVAFLYLLHLFAKEQMTMLPSRSQ